MDHHREPYPDNEDLKMLRSKLVVIRSCGDVSNIDDEDEAYNSLTRLHPEAESVFSEFELLTFIRLWRSRQHDSLATLRLDHEVYLLELGIGARVQVLDYQALYGPVISASPVRVGEFARLQLLEMLYPNGESVLILESSQIRTGTPWNTMREGDVEGKWFWPLPVAADDGALWIRRKAASVAAWNCATGNFSTSDFMLMRDQLISRQIPLRLAVSFDRGVTLIFPIEANNQKDWAIKCEELRKSIQGLGVHCPSFLYDFAVPMIYPQARVVYLNP